MSGQPTVHVLQAAFPDDQGFPLQVIPFGLLAIVLIAVLGFLTLAVLIEGHPVLFLKGA